MLDAHSAPGASARAQLPLVALPKHQHGTPNRADSTMDAARRLLPFLAAGRKLDTDTLRSVMTDAFGATDTAGAWLWKDAYEAAEAAVILFLRRYARALQLRASDEGPPKMVSLLEAIATLEPSHTRRSEDQVRLQQFSTPIPLAYAAVHAAAIRPDDVILEPSAGTGMLAVMAQLVLDADTDHTLHLNEIAGTRAALLHQLFPDATVSTVNAETVADRLPGIRPTAVIMNPPFSATPGVDAISHHADLRHVRSAFSMLPPGGRLSAITSSHCLPGNPAWRTAFDSLDPPARVVFTSAIDGQAYARRGTSFDTRLTVLDRSSEPSIDIDPGARVRSAHELLAAIRTTLPARSALAKAPTRPAVPTDLFGNRLAAAAPPATSTSGDRNKQTASRDWGPIAALTVQAAPSNLNEDPAASHAASGPYEAWRPGSIHVPGSTPHPTPLVQSAAMAAVPHPEPAYRPILPVRIVQDAHLSDAQLESVVLAGEAHSRHLPTLFRIGSGWETVKRSSDVDTPDPDTGRHPDLPRRKRRNPLATRPVPPRLDVRRRHRRRQGPRGCRRHPRQLVAGPHPCALALRVRQARRGRTPRLDGARRTRLRRRPDLTVPPGRADPAQGSHPLLDLRDPAIALAPGKALAARTDRRMACRLARRAGPPRL